VASANDNGFVPGGVLMTKTNEVCRRGSAKEIGAREITKRKQIFEKKQKFAAENFANIRKKI